MTLVLAGSACWPLIQSTTAPAMFRLLALLPCLLLAPPVLGQVFEPILEARFDDKPLGQPIGIGGPLLGEPLALDVARLATQIVAATPGRALRTTRLETPASTAASSVRFGFRDNRELLSGPVRISVRLSPEQIGAYALRTREAGGSAVRWIDLEFLSDGTIRRQVRSGTSSVIGNYSAGQALNILILGDFSANTYSISVNGAVLDTGTFDATARGLGSVLFSFLAGSDNFNKSLIIDDLLVEVPADQIFKDRFQ